MSAWHRYYVQSLYGVCKSYGAYTIRIVKGCVREVRLAQVSCILRLCCSAHTSGCVVDGLGATAAF